MVRHWGLLLLLVGACGVETDETPAEGQTPNDDEIVDEEETGISSIEDYVSVYCDYAVQCNLYAVHEQCMDDVQTRWFADCSVASVPDLNVCADWISSLTCEDEGWIEACDNAFDCS